MEPLPPTPINRLLATVVGFLFGVGIQLGFLFIVNRVIGPIPDGLNSKLLAWTALLLAPPILSYLFVRIAPGSIGEDFFKGFQLVSVVWIILVVIAIIPAVRALLNFR